MTQLAELTTNRKRRNRGFIMFVVITCTISTGRVERKTFDTWETARSYASARDGKNGQRVRIDLERAQRPVAPVLAVRLNRCLAA